MASISSVLLVAVTAVVGVNAALGTNKNGAPFGFSNALGGHRNVFVGDRDDCLLAEDILTSCSSVMPNPTEASDRDFAKCLCCEDGVWDPAVFDKPASSCYDYITDEIPQSTAVASFYSLVSDICESVGSVACIGAATPALTNTATATADPTDSQVTGSAGCDSVISMYDVCSSSVPNFDDATNNDVADCVCYDDKEWSPEEFDGNFGDCLAWASTGWPAFYSSNSKFEDFCDQIGPKTFANADITTNGLPEITNSGLPTNVAVTVVDQPTTATSTDSAESAGSPIVPQSGIVGFIVWILGFYVMV